MGLLDVIRRNRAQMSEAIGEGKYIAFSACNAARFSVTRDAIEDYARGRVLDVGCGHMPFRAKLLQHASSYEGFDIEARVPGVSHVGDAQKMTAIPDASYDTVTSFEVLEHLPHPTRAVNEMARVLKPAGVLLLTVPHLSRLHEEPHDYFRYTRHGLRVLLEDAGLTVVEIRHHAGLLSFLGHQLSTIVLGSLWSLAGVRQVVYAINYVLLVAPTIWLDRAIDRHGTFALGYLAVARKPGATPSQ